MENTSVQLYKEIHRMLYSFNSLKVKQKRILGIDITSSSVKLLEISQTKDTYCVLHHASMRLPCDIMDGVKVKDISGLSHCIRQLTQKNGFLSRRLLTKEAIIAIPDSCAITKIVQVGAFLDEQDLEEFVRMEVDKLLPTTSDEIYFDYKLLEVSNKEVAMRDVFIIATSAPHIYPRITALRQAGIAVKIVDVESSAILRVLQWVMPNAVNTNKKPVVILDIGAIFCKTFILKDSNIIFSFEELLNWEKLTDVKNEETKFKLVTQVVAHVNRALQFFYSSINDPPMAYIILIGGVLKHENIAFLLEKSLAIPVVMCNPFAQMKFAKTVNKDQVIEDAPLLMTACGLALRAW